jgi:hypothetical protein
MLVALSLLLVLACVVPASAQLAGAPGVRESAAHSGIPWNRYHLISGAASGKQSRPRSW